MKTSTETNKVLAALANLKKEMSSVAKTSENPFYKSSYADLNAHLDVVEPLAEKFGLLVTQGTNVYTETGVPSSTVETRITHVESGEFVASELLLILPKQDMQQMGSAVTYARRYTLGALLGMKAVDDDGNVATNGVTKPAKTTTSTLTSTTAPKSSFRKNKTRKSVV